MRVEADPALEERPAPKEEGAREAPADRRPL